ncbi:DUF5134 domain-containing protein [Streptomyces sp. NPDC018031]|uniref:DUF5134 domain-containing protein n=1 Tax=Streptomyces sp. NPDC018031 TaxID=3365033 RepID=UPI00378BDBE9
MHGPPLIGWLLLVLGTASGAYCTARARAAPPGLRWAPGSEALLGWGMAVMTLPAVAHPGGSWGPSLPAAVAGVAAVPALLPRRCAGGDGRRFHHTVEAVAMVYVCLVMVVWSRDGHHGTGPPGTTEPLTAALLAYFTGYVLRTGLRLVPAPGGGPAPDTVTWSRRPEIATACRLAMAIGMCAMLLTL